MSKALQRSTPKALQPFSPDELRKKMLAAAGYDEARQVEILKEVLDSAVRDLNAEKVEVISYLGVVTDKVKVPDNAARGKAREQLTKLFGFEQGGQQGGNKVSLEVPPWVKRVAVMVEAHPSQETDNDVQTGTDGNSDLPASVGETVDVDLVRVLESSHEPA